MDQSVIMWLIGGVFSVLFGLLKFQNAQQSKQIDLLFDKHDADVQRLQDLELKIAQKHYVKEELDVKFDRLESAFMSGMKSLGDKFDQLSARLVEHMMRDEQK